MWGAVASWLARSTLEWALRVRALVGDIVLCSWARHFIITLTEPLSTQVYKWVPANLMLGVTLRWTSTPIQGGVEILPVASCYRNRDKLRPDRPLGPNADFTLPYYFPPCGDQRDWKVVSLHCKQYPDSLLVFLCTELSFHYTDIPLSKVFSMVLHSTIKERYKIKPNLFTIATFLCSHCGHYGEFQLWSN